MRSLRLPFRAARLAVPVFVAVVSTAPLAAQAVLRPGVEARGELRAGDLRLDDNTYADLWRFSGTAGQEVRITLRSSAFDAYLSVGWVDDAGDYHELGSDDDGAGGADALVRLTLSRSGDFIARANTLNEGETGAYSLVLETGAAAPAEVAVEAPAGGGALVSATPGAHMPLVLGQELRGQLGPGDERIDDSSYADIWVYQGRRGETLTMVQRSTEVNSYLTFGPVVNGHWQWWKSDNDGAGGKDAKLVVTLPSDGEYWVRPNALFAGEGAYTLLVVSDQAGPGAPAPTAAAPAPSAPAAPLPSAGPLQEGMSLSRAIKGEAATPPAVEATPTRAARPVRREVKPLKKGEEVSGKLTEDDEDSGDGTYVDTWSFEGKKGQVVIITMKSPDFRPYLLLGRAPRGGDTFSSIETDGASVGEPAKVTVELPADGKYWVRANTFDKKTGRYTLKLKVR